MLQIPDKCLSQPSAPGASRKKVTYASENVWNILNLWKKIDFIFPDCIKFCLHMIQKILIILRKVHISSGETKATKSQRQICSTSK